MTSPRFDLVAIDVDGTLLDSTGRLSPENERAVRAAVERGVRVVLATARPPRTTRPLAERLGLAGAAGSSVHIHYDGAVVWSARRNGANEHWALPARTSQSVIAAARAAWRGVSVSIEHLDRWYADHLKEGLTSEVSLATKPDYVGPLESFMHIPPTRLTLAAPPEHLGAVRKIVMDEYVGPGHASCSASAPHLLQVVAPGVDKGAAVRWIAEMTKTDRRRVMAIGDGPNDAGMLRWAGLGVAVGNAWGETRIAADERVEETCDESAVAATLGRFLFNK